VQLTEKSERQNSLIEGLGLRNSCGGGVRRNVLTLVLDKKQNFQFSRASHLLWTQGALFQRITINSCDLKITKFRKMSLEGSAECNRN